MEDTRTKTIKLKTETFLGRTDKLGDEAAFDRAFAFGNRLADTVNNMIVEELGHTGEIDPLATTHLTTEVLLMVAGSSAATMAGIVDQLKKLGEVEASDGSGTDPASLVADFKATFEREFNSSYLRQADAKSGLN